jgi:hypoxanthine phosphoribosyltransferase
MSLHSDVAPPDAPLTLAYWQRPQGVAVEGDSLKFLYIPDDAEHLMVSWLAKQVFEHQRAHRDDGLAITKMVMITMGALLPGVYLHDAVTYGADADLPKIEFGTFGVRFYKGPGQPLAEPKVVQPLSIDVRGHIVGIIEDLADLGKTAKYVQSHLTSPDIGARGAVLITPFIKTSAAIDSMPIIACATVPADTWIITPRERIETIMKRIPYWRSKGLTRPQCERNLRRIGYPDYLLEYWMDLAWSRPYQN